jgi:hypothetical protein
MPSLRTLEVSGFASIYFMYVGVQSNRNPLRKEGSMCRPKVYSWQIPYVVAILETDDTQRCRQVYEAMAAIDQRRKDPVNGDEGLALAEAETGLQILISEAIARCD